MRKSIGHYEIVAELGRGGMGVVYKAFEPSLNRHVAIKTLADHLASDAGVVERFMREARAMAQLSDAHIVPIHYVGEERGLPYFAMEFVEGESLAGRLKREGRLAPEEARRIVLQAAQGLAVAHEHGVIHRDIKPANLLLTRRGVVKVADFGIALAASDLHQKLTGTGQLVGTPGYLSPEVCLGKPTDARSDIFSLGIVLFEMLTGRMPFLDESPLGLMLSVVQSQLPDVRELASNVDDATVQILEGMVAKDPESRFQNCEALIQALLAVGTPYHPLQAGHTPAPGHTPAAGHSQAATSLATPLPTPRPAAQPPAAAPLPPPMPPPASAPAQVAPTPAAAAAPRRSSNALPWVIAAVLMLGIASAGGYLWLRSDNDDARQSHALAAIAAPLSADDSPSPSTTMTGASDSAPAATATLAAPADEAAAASADTSAPAVATLQPTAGSGATLGTEMTTKLDASADGASPATPSSAAVHTAASAAPELAEAAGPAAAAAPQRSDAAPTAALAEWVAAAEAPAPASSSASAPSTATPSAPARASAPAVDPAAGKDSSERPVREQLASLREQRNERRPPADPTPQLPRRTLVIAVGDPAITGPAQAAIEEALEDAGVALADAWSVPGLERLADGDGDAGELMRAVARAGVARTIVTLRVVPTGQQELTYYGEVSTLYTAQLRLRAFDVAERRPIGRLAQTQVSFTQLNADYNTRQALAPLLERMVSALR